MPKRIHPRNPHAETGTWAVVKHPGGIILGGQLTRQRGRRLKAALDGGNTDPAVTYELKDMHGKRTIRLQQQ